MFLETWKSNRGVSIVEILVIVAIIGTALTSLLGLAVFSLKSTIMARETMQANILAQEAIEATRAFRDGTTWNVDGLGTLTSGTAYYPAIQAGSWVFVAGEETIGNFKRKVVFGDVMRDNVSKDIVASGGTIDPNTRKVTATVTWGNKKVELITYLTNWR